MSLKYVAFVELFVTVTFVSYVHESFIHTRHPEVLLNITAVKLEQAVNAKALMLVTLLGIVIVVKLAQL